MSIGLFIISLSLKKEKKKKRKAKGKTLVASSLLPSSVAAVARRHAQHTQQAPMASAVRSKATALASAATKAASPAIEAAQKHFNKLIADNAQYVVKDKDAADMLTKQLVFTKLAR